MLDFACPEALTSQPRFYELLNFWFFFIPHCTPQTGSWGSWPGPWERFIDFFIPFKFFVTKQMNIWRSIVVVHINCHPFFWWWKYQIIYLESYFKLLATESHQWKEDRTQISEKTSVKDEGHESRIFPRSNGSPTPDFNELMQNYYSVHCQTQCGDSMRQILHSPEGLLY